MTNTHPMEILAQKRTLFIEADADQCPDVRVLMTAALELSDARERAARHLTANHARLELRNASGLGAAISPSLANIGHWRITWFDQFGLSGDSEFSTKNDTVLYALQSGYDIPSPGLMKAYCRDGRKFRKHDLAA